MDLLLPLYLDYSFLTFPTALSENATLVPLLIKLPNSSPCLVGIEQITPLIVSPSILVLNISWDMNLLSIVTCLAISGDNGCPNSPNQDLLAFNSLISGESKADLTISPYNLPFY